MGHKLVHKIQSVDIILEFHLHYEHSPSGHLITLLVSVNHRSSAGSYSLLSPENTPLSVLCFLALRSRLVMK